MPDSNERILMCKKAVEIQDLWTPSCGDLVVHPRLGGMEIFTAAELEEAINYSRNFIWLPTQANLQDLLQDKFSTRELVPCLEKLTRFKLNHFREYKTWDLLWLGFVMKEKFNKQWTGKDWEKR